MLNKKMKTLNYILIISIIINNMFMNVFANPDVETGLIKNIITKDSSTFILKNDGTVWATGRNDYGQLGLGDTTNRSSFTKVDISDVREIVTEGYSTFVIKNDGTLWATGMNTRGQLGLRDTTNRSSFTKVDIDNVLEVTTRNYTTVVYKDDYTVWGTGYNAYGQLGLGDTKQRTSFTQMEKNVLKVSFGGTHTFIYKSSANILATGYNTYGQLGLGDTTDRVNFTKVSITGVEDVKAIYDYTLLLKTDGTVWGTGYNKEGKLGVGDTTNKSVFTKSNMTDVAEIIATPWTAYAIRNTGTVWGAGYNAGQLAIGNSTNQSSFKQVYLSNVENFVLGQTNTWGIKTDGTLWTCGRNLYGELGLNDTTNRSDFTQVTVNTDNVKDIYHDNEKGYETYMVKTDGTLWVTGYNSKGQLGLGDTINREVFTRIELPDDFYADESEEGKDEDNGCLKKPCVDANCPNENCPKPDLELSLVNVKTSKQPILAVAIDNSGSGINFILDPDGNKHYTDTITFMATENKEYTFYTEDNNGNGTYNSITVNHIIEDIEECPDGECSHKGNLLLIPSTKDWTNGNVIITALVTNTHNETQYIKLPNGNMVKSDVANYTVSENDMYVFEAIDVENQFYIESIVISNIDKKKPNVEIINNEDWSNENVKVDIMADDN